MTTTNSNSTLSVAVPRPIDHLFTYRIPDEFLPQAEIGNWVKVPFGRTVTHAFIVEKPKILDQTENVFPKTSVSKQLDLKDILDIGKEGPVIPQDVLSLCQWAQDYYSAPLGEVLNCAISAQFLKFQGKKAKPKIISKEITNPTEVTQFELSEEQKCALEVLEKIRIGEKKLSGPTKVALLQGVTGSGKTEVYIELAKRTLREGKSVLILVPEIALSSQLHERFQNGVGVAVGLWHSAVSENKRAELRSALLTGKIRILVGARSAVFAPLPNLGTIIIDEEHDPSYKQEDRVRYHARDLAIVRAKITGAFALLGSATPSLESLERVRENRYGFANLTQRATPGGMPKIELVDLCTEEKVGGIQAPLALKTLSEIQKTLDLGQQVMIYLNRRGYASFIVCEDCGEVPECKNCSISMTVYKAQNRLRCHVCGYSEKISGVCKNCHGFQLKAMGAGTESLEEELPKLLTNTKILRLDRDQITSVSRLNRVLDDFSSGKANILLGTQMLVKGHDFPGVTLVVVILADALFRFPDFRASERAFQILTQVAGRAGRREAVGKVLIQTYRAEHPVLGAVRGESSPQAFLNEERELRQALSYPPFSRMVRIRFESKKKEDAQSKAHAIAEILNKRSSKTVVLGPTEAFLERAKGIYRWDLLFKSTKYPALQEGLFQVQSLCKEKKWSCLVDVDPYGIG